MTEHVFKQWLEIEWNFVADIEPFQKGVYSGPPENCFPDEGGFATIAYATLGKCTFEREYLLEHEMFNEQTLVEIEEDIYSDWEASQDN